MDIHTEIPYTLKRKTSMSITEMRRLLGLGKTDSYWLVQKKYFKTVVVAGKMRVMIDSFEEWYAGQFHYKKVCGEPPGARWENINMSVQETADLIGITTSTLYDLLKKEPFKTERINSKLRIDIKSFEKWYKNQSHYKKGR
ncbi:phage antirepressor YoqD-like protein [Lachnospiraceae bacterium PF1-21]|uniref:Helix-turn-helix domain-containing protein n=1 Tax=Ohessyouella blattaphilus TaxID=2949333 RepID=A0ABT1EJL0_9FIRM|nr:helix-turn-helix domain-containing protein [Ohessyouella blattaphilus]MCP1110873.1 helix-turn-helix domain-containing protein [Ohessyouella blattaphilus]MCR8564267.1 helix-turn-helix domain-containing protein [Ohessyouella blattaphilus]